MTDFTKADVVAADGRFAGITVGTVTRRPDGWYFNPHFQSNRSRRGWPTPEAALKGRIKWEYRLENKIAPKD